MTNVGRGCGCFFFLIGAGDGKVIASLNDRETGEGYRGMWVRVFAESEGGGKRVVVQRALTYKAGIKDKDFLGFASHEEIAKQIERGVGTSGTNVEYLHRLHEALVEMGREDAHVSALYALTGGGQEGLQ